MKILTLFAFGWLDQIFQWDTMLSTEQIRFRGMFRLSLSHFFPHLFLFLVFSPSIYLSRELSFSRASSSTCRILSTVASRYVGFSRVKKNSCLIAGINLKALCTRDCACLKKSEVVFFSLRSSPVLSFRSANIFFSDLYLLIFCFWHPNYFN